MDIDEQSVNDILDEDLERWSDFSIEEELPLLTNNCEGIGESDIDTFNATLKLDKNSENRSGSSQLAEVDITFILRVKLKKT